MRRLPVRHRLVLLGSLGVLLIMLIAGTALVSLSNVADINRKLAQVSIAQRYHQDADMMHDALRADVARAAQVGAGRPGVTPASIRRESQQHAATFRADLSAIQRLKLPARLARSMDRLAPAQRAYIARAEQVVASELRGTDDVDAALAGFQRAFTLLVPAFETVTSHLAATSADTARVARSEESAAVRMVVVAGLAALAGWLTLTALLYRSADRLRAALVRESVQRAAVDLLERSMLPERLPVLPGLQFAARSLPGTLGRRVGGDWYDVIELPSGEVGLVVGDVVGHDLPAATAMSQLRNALRAYALDEPSPALVLSRVNRAAELLNVAEMATCLYAVIDPATSNLRWSSAGHPNPLVSSAKGQGRLLVGDPGPPFCVTQTAHYRDRELQLGLGESILLYTDGLVERRDESIDVGLQRLQSVPGPHRSPDALCDDVLSALFCDSSQCDDVTLLALQA